MAIKVLHTSDWHLGAKFLGQEMLDEYESFFKRLRQLIARDKVRLMLLAGDIFDDSRPSNAVLRFFEKEMRELHEAFPALRSVLIAGNHEDGEWLESMGEKWAAWNIQVIGTFRKVDNDRIDMGRHILSFEGCEVVAVPYPNLKSFVPTKSESREELFIGFLRALTERVKLTVVEKRPIILMTHCYVRTSDQMRGKGKDTIGEEDVPGFYDYVAMGHAHSHHQVGKEKMIFYSGSPWPVSCNDNRRRSVIILKLPDEKSPLKLTVPPVENLRPVELVPRRPAGMQTVLEKLKGLPQEKPRIVVLNVRKPELPEFNEQLFLSDVEKTLEGSTHAVAAVQWVDKKGSVSCKTLIGKDSPSDEEKRDMLYPIVRGLDTVRRTVEGTVNQIEEICRQQNRMIEESERERDSLVTLCELSNEWQRLCRYWGSLKERLEQLERIERSSEYAWEESMVKIWRDDRIEERLAGKETPTVDYTQSADWKDCLERAKKAAKGYFHLKERTTKLEEQKKQLQVDLTCKENADRQKELSQELKIVKAAYAKTVRERDMSASRIKLLEKEIGIALLDKNSKGAQVAHLIKTVNKLISRVERLKQKEPTATSAKEGRKQVFEGFLEKLPEGRPPFWDGPLGKDIEYIRLTVSRHTTLSLEKQRYLEEIRRVESRMEDLMNLGVDNTSDNAWLTEKTSDIFEKSIESARQSYGYTMQLKRSIVSGRDQIAALSKKLKDIMDQLAARDSH